MKKEILINVLLVVFFSLNLVTASSQDKASLTKGETINYINKKVKECIGHFRTPVGFNSPVYYYDAKFKEDGDNVTLEIESSNYSERKSECDYWVRSTWQTFNPGKIVSITDETINAKDPIGIIILKLNSTTGISKNYVQWYRTKYTDGTCKNFGNGDGTKTQSIKEVGLIFQHADPENFNKLKKALGYLRDLYKAEDDPFGN